MAMAPSTAANARAFRCVNKPTGNGLAHVLAICASMRRSMTWLMVAAEPDASATPRVLQRRTFQGGSAGEANNVPASDVKVIRVTTLGFVSCTYPRHLARRSSPDAVVPCRTAAGRGPTAER